MKKFIIINFLLVATSAMAATSPDAQVTTKSTATQEAGVITTVIPQAGVVLATFVGDNTSGTTTHTGLNIGALADFGRSNLQLESGLLYRQLGTKMSSRGVDASFDMNYISIPFMAKYNFSGFDTNTAYLKIGAVPAFAVSRSVTAKAGSISATVDVADETNSFDIGVGGGLGGKFNVSPGMAFVVEADYIRGLTKLNSKGGDSIYNSDLSISAGLGIEL